MNCSRFESLIALYVEGDLPERQVHLLEQHLYGCPACREFSDTLKQSQLHLKHLRGESLEEAVFQQVRSRVMSQISSSSFGQHRRSATVFLASWSWKPALVGALLMLLVSFVLWRSQTPDVPTPSVPVVHREADGAPVATAPKQEPVPKRGVEDNRVAHKALSRASSNPKVREQRPVVRQLRSVLQASQTMQGRSPSSESKERPTSDTKLDHPLVIRLVTDDPEVLIVWLVDQDRGEK